ncbi:MAG: serine hydrolase [Gammaproteobacteria bacterium]|nr:serine hydrolase [Gammaproteobacteria bacterium]
MLKIISDLNRLFSLSIKISLVFIISIGTHSLADDLMSVTPEEAGYDSAKLSSVSDGFEALYEDGLIPNYIIAVAKEGKVFYSASNGNARVETDNPVDLNTLYPLASMTKPFVSTAIMRLIEDGQLKLDSQLSEFLPQFSDMFVAPGGSLEQLEESNRPITILDLMTHTSGLTYGEYVTGVGDVAKLYDEFNIIDRCISREENMDILSQIPLVAQPGTEWNYSVGTDVLGAVIEIVTGMTMGDYLDEILFTPLNMTGAGFTMSEENLTSNWAMIYGLPGANNPAIGQVEGSEIYWKIAEVDGNENAERPSFMQCPRGLVHGDERYQFDSGGGGINGSGQDYLKFMSMIMNGGEFQGQRIISEESVAFMLSEQVDVAYPAQFGNNIFGAGFGINLQLDNPSEVDFYRWGGAYNTGFWMDPADNSVGVILSSHWPGRYNRGNAIEQMLDDARIEK